VAGNTASRDCDGQIVSLGYNLHGGTCLPAPAPSDVTVASTQVFTHWLEQELEDNGGPTSTHALIERGLAVDAGYCPGETEDQRGFARPVDVSGIANARDGCVSANRGTLTGPPVGETGTVSWYLGALDDGANEVAELVVTVRVRSKTTITHTSTVTGDVMDPNPANDSASLTVSVAAAG
jgi:hypothetical protein